MRQRADLPWSTLLLRAHHRGLHYYGELMRGGIYHVVGHAMEVNAVVDPWDSSFSLSHSLLSNMPTSHPSVLCALVGSGPQQWLGWEGRSLGVELCCGGCGLEGEEGAWCWRRQGEEKKGCDGGRLIQVKRANMGGYGFGWVVYGPWAHLQMWPFKEAQLCKLFFRGGNLKRSCL